MQTHIPDFEIPFFKQYFQSVNTMQCVTYDRGVRGGILTPLRCIFWDDGSPAVPWWHLKKSECLWIIPGTLDPDQD